MNTNEMREIARILDHDVDYVYQRASKALFEAADEIDALRAAQSGEANE